MSTKSPQALRLEPSVRVRRRTHSLTPDLLGWELVEDIVVAPSEVDPWVNNQLAQEPGAFVSADLRTRRTVWSVIGEWAAS